MKKIYKRINKWFELTVGWFLINGRKQEKYAKYLKDKYQN